VLAQRPRYEPSGDKNEWQQGLAGLDIQAARLPPNTTVTICEKPGVNTTGCGRGFYHSIQGGMTARLTAQPMALQRQRKTVLRKTLFSSSEAELPTWGQLIRNF